MSRGVCDGRLGRRHALSDSDQPNGAWGGGHGGARANIGIDIYNLLNSDAALSYNQTFIADGPWLTPTSVMLARFAKISAQIDF